MRILRLTKSLMYDFHFNYIKKYGNKAKFLLADRDSFAFEPKANKVSEYFYKDNDEFDFSNYSQNSYFSGEINKITAGNMKDETKYFPIVEIVRLMSKLYSYMKEL